MHRGYIKIHRKIQDSFIYKDSFALHLWIHLILEANHKDREFIFNNKKQVCKRGQLLTGLNSLACETKINRSKVNRLLKMFKNETLIETQKTNRFTIITVLKYGQYQIVNGKSETQNETPVKLQRNSSETPVKPNNNDNTLKNVNNVNTTSLVLPKEAVELADLLYTKIKENNPNALLKESFKAKWSNDLRLLNEQDKQPYTLIKQVLLWSQADDFWSKNILSGSKLRMKWNQLSSKMNGSKKSDLIVAEAGKYDNIKEWDNGK